MTQSAAKTAITPSTHTRPPAKFSHGVRKGDILQVAGQVGFLPAAEGRPPTPAGPDLRSQVLSCRPLPTSGRSSKRAARPGRTR